MKQVYINQKTQTYCIRIGEVCELCHKEITKQVTIFKWYCKKGRGKMLVCTKCTKELDITSQYGIIKEIASGVVIKKLGRNTIPVLDRAPQLTDSKGQSIYDGYNIESERTVDKTHYARMLSIEGGVHGEVSFDGKEKRIGSEKELDYLLEENAVSKPIIEEDKKRLIE